MGGGGELDVLMISFLKEINRTFTIKYVRKIK